MPTPRVLVLLALAAGCYAAMCAAPFTPCYAGGDDCLCVCSEHCVALNGLTSGSEACFDDVGTTQPCETADQCYDVQTGMCEATVLPDATCQEAAGYGSCKTPTYCHYTKETACEGVWTTGGTCTICNDPAIPPSPPPPPSPIVPVGVD